MKQGPVLFLLAWGLLACTSLSILNRYNCGQGICTTVQVVEPVRRNEPVTVVVTVTADRDLPDLGVSLTPDLDGQVEEPPASEMANITFRDKSGIGWAAPVKANQPARFTRKIKLPSRDGIFQIIASAGTPKTGQVATDSVRIYLTADGGTVYRSGTSIPTPATPIRAITLTATPVGWKATPTATATGTPTLVRTPTRVPYP